MAAPSRPWSEPEMEAAKAQSVVCRSDSAFQKPRRARRETVLQQSPRREELPTQQRGGATWSAQRSALCMGGSAAATVPPREARDKYWHRGDKRGTVIEALYRMFMVCNITSVEGRRRPYSYCTRIASTANKSRARRLQSDLLG